MIAILVVTGVLVYLISSGMLYPVLLRRSKDKCRKYRCNDGVGCDHEFTSAMLCIFWPLSVPVVIGGLLGEKADVVTRREKKADAELAKAKRDREIARLRREEAEETVRQLQVVWRDDELKRLAEKEKKDLPF